MNEEEHKKYLQDLKDYCAYLLEDKDRCMNFMIDAGIYDKDGNPSDWWKDDNG